MEVKRGAFDRDDALRQVKAYMAGKSCPVGLHVPHIALREGRSVIRRKFQPKESAALQRFRKWATERGHCDLAASQAANEFLTMYSNTVTADLDNLDARIQEVARTEVSRCSV